MSNAYVEIEGKNFLRYVKGNIIGNGTKDNPYRIGKNDNFPNKVKLIQSEHYIEFLGIEFIGFGVIGSKNITFIDCYFTSLTFQRSENVVMNESQIVNLYLRNGKSSHFKGCSINWIHNFFSSGNVFEHCKIGNPQSLQVGIIQATGFHKILLYLILFLLATMVPDIYFAITLWHDFLSVIGLSVVIAILSVIYLLIRRSFKKDEKRPNIIKNVDWKSKSKVDFKK